LFYRNPFSHLVSVRIRTEQSFSVDDAVALGGDALVTDAGYDLVPRRGFIVPVHLGRHEPTGPDSTHQIAVVLNWLNEIRRAVRRDSDLTTQ
jgi:hypothetical protein